MRVTSPTVLVCLGLCAACLPCLAAEEGSQTVGGMRYQTANYQLVMWGAGHFALKVGGSWMPGCVCLNLGSVAQYQTDHLSYMDSESETTPDGRTVTITGRLTPDLRFTQTMLCAPDGVTLTYSVEALADMQQADIRITAGPQVDQMAGKTLEINSAGGSEQYTWPPAQPIAVKGVQSLVWHDVGKREARTVFADCAASQVSLSGESSVYTAWLRPAGPMRQGETAQATLRFEAIPIGDAADTVAGVQGSLGMTRFTVSGSNGLLHNVRTNQGLLIQQLSINEHDTHQVQVGRGRGTEWGGVRLGKAEPGAQYDITGTGPIINPWEETIAARRVSGERDEIDLSAHRELEKGPQRLRLLMYVAQWLEQERVPFYLRTPDGLVQTHDAGEPMWFGMPPKSAEAGLGPYRSLGTFPAETEVVVPMLRRGEIMTVRLGQPMEISGFRFETYFRGLWFQAPDNSAQDLDVKVTVQRLPQRHVGTVDVATDPVSGAVALGVGGIPLLDGICARGAQGEVLPGEWSWTATDHGAEGALAVKRATVEMRIPEHLFGKQVTVAGNAGETPAGAQPLRLGADLPPMELLAGSRLEFCPTALERASVAIDAPASIAMRREAPGGARLVVEPRQAEARVTISHEAVVAPKPDPITSRPAHPAAQEDPGVYGGLSVKSDSPEPGDVTLTTPWWEVVHSAAQGGAITSIRFLNGTDRNILQGPIATTIAAEGEYLDTLDSRPTLAVEQDTSTYARLKVTGQLRSVDGKTLCPFEHVYEYRPMLVRRTCRYLLPESGVQCSGLCVGSMTLAPWLDECAYRRADDRTTWGHAVFPGPAALSESSFSQYMCLFGRGVEGIDWLPASDLAQWQGVGGLKDGAHYGIEGDAVGNPRMVIEPVARGSEPVTLAGELKLESYLSLPQTRRCLQRRNFIACLDNGDCTPQMLGQCADHGVTDILLGCGNNPGSFELTDLKASQQSVRAAAQQGIKVYPFDPFQLVNRRAPLWQQHELMERMELKSGEPVPAVYSDYGDYFCPTCREFREALQSGYAKLIESAGFTGMYHDFTHPYTCYSTRHHPAPHINTDGVVDIVLWEREYLGRDRVFCGHTGWVPALLFQDLCTVTAIFEEYPSTEPLPLHLMPAQGEFVNAAQRTLVSSFLANGAGAPGEENPVPPPELVDAYLSRCALVGIFPWMHGGSVGAADGYELLEKSRPWLRLFALRGQCDLGRMKFLPWHRQTAVLTSNPLVRAATYWSEDRAIIVLANSESAKTVDFTCTVLPEQLGWPAGSTPTLTPSRGSSELQPGEGANAFVGTLGGFGWSAYEVRRR